MKALLAPPPLWSEWMHTIAHTALVNHGVGVWIEVEHQVLNSHEPVNFDSRAGERPSAVLARGYGFDDQPVRRLCQMLKRSRFVFHLAAERSSEDMADETPSSKIGAQHCRRMDPDVVVCTPERRSRRSRV